MAKFLVTYATGNQTVTTQSDADTVEQFINTHFGSAWDPEAGGTVELVDDDFELSPAVQVEAAGQLEDKLAADIADLEAKAAAELEQAEKDEAEAEALRAEEHADALNTLG